MAGVIVEVSSRKFGVPFECPCCGAAPEVDVRVVSRTSGKALAFSYCRRCVAHVSAWESAGVASAAVMLLGILSAIVIAVAAKLWLGLVVFVAAATIAWWVRGARRAAATKVCGASCASPHLALEYRGWSGQASSFSFQSPTFAARFAEQNQSLLANMTPQLRKLLDGYRKARLAVPTPAVAAGVAPPPLTVKDWLARLETTEGTVARRVALGRALEMIAEAAPRRELIQTVARLELAPLLERLARVQSAAQKKSLLERAIADLGVDNIPDELEAVELQQLQARVAEL
ncbi:MAG: hypothetical protein HOV81_37920 [Kofleriaceae bacterium]|nr:hypothetical protein [Kofleriaceae bacterium]